MKIRIHHHIKFESGNYVGTIPKPLKKFILELIKASKLEIKTSLKNSDNFRYKRMESYDKDRQRKYALLQL